MLALALYALAAVLAMWALVANLGVAVPAGPETDYYIYHWNLWWMRHALSQGWDLFHTDWLLFPLEHNLSLHTLAITYLPAYLVLELLAGRMAALNLMVLAAPVLSAYAMFLFLRHYLDGTSRDWMALIGGFVFGFLPFEIAHGALAHLSYIALWWFPLALLLWDHVVSATNAKRQSLWAVALGLALWGAWLTDTQFLLWLPPLIAPYGLYTVARAPTWRRRGALLGMAAAAMAVTLALGWIAPLRALQEMDPGLLPKADLYPARYLSLALGALFLMPGPGEWGFGRLLVILAVAGALWPWLWRRLGRATPRLPRARWLWLAIAAGLFVFALGPDIEVGGQLIPMPYRALHDALQGQYRTPVRLTVPALFALVTFCALSFLPLIERARWRSIIAAATMAAFTLDFGLLNPFPVAFPPDYAIYHEIGQEPGDWVLFEVPTGMHSGYYGIGRGQRLMFYAPVHHKRLVNGLIARIPWTSHVFYEQTPLLTAFSGERHALDPPTVSRALTRSVDAWPVGYVIVHPDLLPGERLLEYTGFLNMQESICFYKAEEGLLIYRAAWHPKGCPPRTPPQEAGGAYVLDLGAPGDEPFIGEYWYWQEDVGGVLARWAGDNDASRLRVQLPPGRGYAMTLVGTGYGVGRTVQVVVNGVSLGTFDLPEGWHEHTVALPAEVVGDGDLLIVLVHGQPTPVGERTLTAAYDRLIFR